MVSKYDIVFAEHSTCTLFTHTGIKFLQSPTSLKVTHHQLVEGAKLSFKDCFKMEYRMAQAYMVKHNDIHYLIGLSVIVYSPSPLSSSFFYVGHHNVCYHNNSYGGREGHCRGGQSRRGPPESRRWPPKGRPSAAAGRRGSAAPAKTLKLIFSSRMVNWTTLGEV